MKPYYEDSAVTLYLGKMEDVLPELHLSADAVITDPPYGETTLAWDRWPEGWPALVADYADSMWCFGSMRMFLEHRDEFVGWRLSQDVVWEKHNGTGFADDRFKRVHELALHFYRGGWSGVRHDAVREDYHGPDKHARARNVDRGQHLGAVGTTNYVDDGRRMVRSVIKAQSVRGGIHPTEKPPKILAPLIEYSVPVGGLVLDPFAGSGSTILTARTLNRRAVGIERSEQYCEKAAERLSIPDLFGGAA